MKTSSILPIFPTGDYKLNFYLFNGREEFVRAELVFSWLSSDKDTFG